MSKDIVNIKGTRNGLVIFVDSNRNFEELKETLKSKIESSQGFFRGAKFTFNLGLNPLSDDKTLELEQICLKNGLVLDKEIPWPAYSEGEKIKPQEKIRPITENIMHQPTPSLPTAGITKNDLKPCLLIERSLRSGHKINYDGNIVVLGDVNPGSEVTATGDIVVYGSLRGVAHAGANNNNDAIIMAFRLNPVQLRIGSIISRPPENASPSSLPEIAQIHHGQMVIEPYQTHGLK